MRKLSKYGLADGRISQYSGFQKSIVGKFAEKVSKKSGYKIIDEKKESRVVLLMKEDKDRFIN